MTSYAAKNISFQCHVMIHKQTVHSFVSCKYDLRLHLKPDKSMLLKLSQTSMKLVSFNCMS